MPIHVTINISESAAAVASQPEGVTISTEGLRSDVRTLQEIFADDISPFPAAGIDGFLSHFVVAVRFLRGERAGQLFTFTLEPAVQTVSRSQPFVYQGAQARAHAANVPMPRGSTLTPEITESQFLVRPAKFFEPGKEHIWLQILNLDAQGQTSLGPVRFKLGETLKRDYPDLFHPSLGLAQSLARSGFPARFFFSPIAVFETPFGAFKTRPKVLEARRIVEIPPIGSVSISEVVPLDSVEELRAVAKGPGAAAAQPAAQLVALAHPIDAALRIPGEEAFSTVQARIA